MLYIYIYAQYIFRLISYDQRSLYIRGCLIFRCYIIYIRSRLYIGRLYVVTLCLYSIYIYIHCNILRQNTSHRTVQINLCHQTYVKWSGLIRTCFIIHLHIYIYIYTYIMYSVILYYIMHAELQCLDSISITNCRAKY